ncbi:hypothetical protein Mic7113_1982 [Allocoleopsis franciscana PCC 7113]|uniref:Uncharacterized protein n=1 Tax=Allocoleopsis franciscana PCC 7113 TaxID=1173027 RepID=K9WDE9_9CYAN|nr:hypothetical protein Mic7113_1982 [Allocoleopsis franciscana PCC 7113]
MASPHLADFAQRELTPATAFSAALLERQGRFEG